jgi:5-methylthioribose kinase
MGRRVKPEVVDWRRALIERRRVPTVAGSLGRLLAEQLFDVSPLALDRSGQRGAKWDGPELAVSVEERVFVAPYRPEPRARLRDRLGADDPVATVDPYWKIAAETLNYALVTRCETMLHGGLDTGAVVVTSIDDQVFVRIARPQQPCRGPIAFDLGTLVGSLFMNIFAQDGYGAGGAIYRTYLVDQAEQLWASFAERFSQRWRGRGDGAAFPRRLFEDEGDDDAAEIALTHFLERIEADALAFAGAEMAQRILDPSPEEDTNAIANPVERGRAERQSLGFARYLMIQRPPTFSAALARLERVVTTAH